MKDTVNHFLRLSQLGYSRLLPIVPPGAELSPHSTLFKRLQVGDDARGKVPGTKGPHGWRSYDWLASDDVHADTWHASGAGVGVKLGRGLVAIDADTYDKDCAKIVKAKIEEVLGVCPPLRIGQFPKALYLVRTDPDFIYTRIEFGERDEKGRLKERVEILAEGRQFVAHGVHPKTMEPYDWRLPLVPFDDLPFASSDQLHRILNELRPLLPAASELKVEGSGAGTDVDQETLRGDPHLVEKAVAVIVNTSERFPTRESYLDVGYAIKAALPDDPAFAFELFADWCARWRDGENDPEVARADWDRMKPPFRRGAPFLFGLADEATGSPENPAPFTGAMLFDQAAASAAEIAPLFPEILPNPFETSEPKRFELTPFDLAASTAMTAAAAPLIKGLLDQGAMTILYGESNAGKTFVAMDIAFHIANGMPWDGRKTARLPVLYIAAEGGQGARKRAAALKAKHGLTDGQFLFLMHPINLLRADADLKPLIEAVRATGLAFGLIVIDTLSRAMAGGDENASTDMGAMVKHLDVLRKATGAHLMAVHHSGKDRARGARGHSLLRAATDTEIEVADRVISVTKQRDLDGSFSSGFELEVHTLGVDVEGDPVTSCTVRLVGRHEVEAVQVGVLTPTEEKVAAAVAELDAFNEGENEGVSVAELVEFLSDKLADLNANALRHYLKQLVQKGVLTKCRRGRWKQHVAASGGQSGGSVFE